LKHKTLFVISSWLAASAMLFGQSTCIPATQEVAPGAGGRGGQGRGPAAAPAPRDLTINAIPGVVAAGGKWTKVWQQAGNSADGILPYKDSVLVAQEDYDTVLRIDKDGKTSVYVAGAKGIGSISMDQKGHLYGAHRTERQGSTKPDRDTIINAITLLAPERKTLADKWSDGSPLTVRPNDLTADNHGGAYFTQGCLYYAGAKGASVAAENLRTNGIVFSPDEKILYVTNGGSVVAFDVQGPGMLTNRRDFAALPTGANGDGMIVDTEGRLYVTSNPGLQVFDKTGKYLGLIPTPRGVISVTFAGPGKKTLYVIGGGADDEKGQPIRQGPQQTAATIYKLPALAQGLKHPAK
jgi:gluconolactonase